MLTQEIAKQTCLKTRVGDILYHKKLKNADGTPQRWRVNGRCQTWKTMPYCFRLPVKRGLKQYGTVNENNFMEFSLEPNGPDIGEEY
jgi:hypothetical protein